MKKLNFDVIQEYEYRGFIYRLLLSDEGKLCFLMGEKFFPADDLYSLCRVEEYIDVLCN